MKENSSRYVDQITLDKLLSEKLEQVHHFPHTGIHFPDSLFSDWSQYQHMVEQQLASCFPPNAISETQLQFKSLVQCEYAENKEMRVHFFSAQNPTVNLVFYHGLFEENREIYQFLFSNLNRLGVNVYLCTLPFHYERMPQDSSFSGEYFWSAFFERTRNAFKQAIYDMHLVTRWVSRQSALPVMFGGFSMGGTVALIYGALHRATAGVVALNPAVSLSEIVWDSPLCKTIKDDYQNAGYEIGQIREAYKGFEPICYTNPKTPIQDIFFGYGCYDLVTSPKLYRSFIEQWHLTQIKEYKSGHLNLLRVPRVANDLFQFWQHHGIT